MYFYLTALAQECQRIAQSPCAITPASPGEKDFVKSMNQIGHHQTLTSRTKTSKSSQQVKLGTAQFP